MMRQVTTGAAGVFLILSLAGCSVAMALSGKQNPNLGAIRAGSTRGEVELQLGSPISSVMHDDGGRSDVYEYELGNEPDTGRAVAWGILDVLTFGLWEVAGTPIEVLQGDKHRITIAYDRNDRVITINQPPAPPLPVKEEGESGLKGHFSADVPETSPVSVSPDEAVATSLEKYAALLREGNQDAEAAVIEGRSAKLRDAIHRPGSTYLGFNPSEILRQYAALLRKQDREVEAKEAEALADWRDRRQTEQFLRLQQR